MQPPGLKKCPGARTKHLGQDTPAVRRQPPEHVPPAIRGWWLVSIWASHTGREAGSISLLRCSRFPFARWP